MSFRKRLKAAAACFLWRGSVCALLLCGIVETAGAESGMTFKITAVNPSELTEREVTVKSYLPTGVGPDNLVDKDELEVGYDDELRQYYLFTKVILPPKESVTYYIEVDDIWVIEDAFIGNLADHAQKLAGKLTSSEYTDVAKILLERVKNNTQMIRTRQADFSADKVTPAEHIGAYEVNKVIFQAIKEDVGALENFVIIGGGNPERILGESSIGVRSLPEEAFLKQQGGSGRALPGGGAQQASDAPPEQTRVLKITMENPSQYESRELPLKYYLPKEIKAFDVVETGELELLFDFQKNLYYVFKDKISLEPGEKKVFEVVVKDKMTAYREKLSLLKKHLEGLADTLADVKEFEATRQFAQETLQKIQQFLSQKDGVESSREYIARLNEKQDQINEVIRDIRRMEDVMVAAGLTPEITIADEEALKQEAEALGISVERLRQIRDLKKKYQKSRLSTNKMKLLANTIFKGKAPTVETTWRIIYIILGFLGVVSLSFLGVWAGQTRKQSQTVPMDLTQIDDRTKEDESQPEDAAPQSDEASQDDKSSENKES